MKEDSRSRDHFCRNLVAVAMLLLHLVGIVGFVCTGIYNALNISEPCQNGQDTSGCWNSTKISLYIGCGVAESILGLLTGILLLLPPTKAYNKVLKVWICITIPILVIFFTLLTLVHVPLNDRLLMLLLAISIYACIFRIVAVSEECQEEKNESSNRSFLSQVRIV